MPNPAIDRGLTSPCKEDGRVPLPSWERASVGRLRHPRSVQPHPSRQGGGRLSMIPYDSRKGSWIAFCSMI
jgi:hypothetical protein